MRVPAAMGGTRKEWVEASVRCAAGIEGAIKKRLELEPGDVLVFTGWLCHAGAERLEDAGESLCLHAYAGDGITPKILQNVFSCLHL